MGGSSQQQTKTVTQNSAPSYALPGLTKAANDATALYKSGAGYDQYAGSSVAPWSSQTQQGVDQLTANAQQPDQLYNATNSGLTDLAQTGGLNQGQTDALGKMNDLYNNNDSNFQSSLDFQNSKIADQVNRQFQGMGAYGGTDYAKALTGELAGNTSQALSNQFNNSQNFKAGIANNLFQGGQQGTNNLTQIGGLLPTLQGARDYNANQLLGAGSLADTHAQNNLDDLIAKFNTAQAAPRQRISDYTGLLSGVVGNYGNQSSTASSPKASTLQQVAGGVLGAGGLLGSLFG